MEEDSQSFIILNEPLREAQRESEAQRRRIFDLEQSKHQVERSLRRLEKESRRESSSFTVDEDLSPIKQAGQHSRLHMESIEVSQVQAGGSRVQQQVEV